VIKVKNLTLTYSNGRGVFNLNFSIKKGEVLGYLGPNGSGKTTTIRALMGFMKPNAGSCSINNLDCQKSAPEIQKFLGYIPGEIAFLEGMKGDEFLKFMCAMRGTKNQKRQKELIEMFELDIKGNIKKYSKGMKQKLAIITAFMHDPEFLILDEPTGGLDPLMQNRFIELILKEKSKGKTILLSSHIFEEVEKICDSVIIIKKGRIVEHSDIKNLKTSQRKGFSITTNEPDKAIELFQSLEYEIGRKSVNEIDVFISGPEIDQFIKILAQIKIINLEAKAQTLEDAFMKYYGKKGE